MLTAGTPKKPIPLAKVVQGLLRARPRPRRIRLAFAYATVEGLKGILPEGKSWAGGIRTEWLIGLNQGITDPGVLEILAKLRNSSVRVFPAPKSAHALAVRPLFHPKVVYADIPRATGCLWLGSANMTASALSKLPTNFELGFLVPRVTATDARTFRAWWHESWSSSRRLTRRAIEDYKAARRALHRRNPDLNQVEKPKKAEWGEDADSFWIEMRMMTGGSGNQADFGPKTRGFLRTKGRQSGTVRIVYRGQPFDRTWTMRTTQAPVRSRNLELYLPTRYGNRPIAYKGRVILLTRDAKHADQYRLEIAPKNSPATRRWRRLSRRSGTIDKTGGGREWGIF